VLYVHIKAAVPKVVPLLSQETMAAMGFGHHDQSFFRGMFIDDFHYETRYATNTR
jgi:hypothetical protein